MISDHYHKGSIECIEAIGSMLEGWVAMPPLTAWMAGNAIKYIWRAPLKGATRRDLDKAIDYLQRIKEQIP